MLNLSLKRQLKYASLKPPKQYVTAERHAKIITGVARITWRAQQSPLLAQQK